MTPTSATHAPMPGTACSGSVGAETAGLGMLGSGLRPSSATVYRRDVAAFLRWRPADPATANGRNILQFIAETASTPAAADRRLAALRHFYRAGISVGCWTTDPTAGLPRAARR